MLSTLGDEPMRKGKFIVLEGIDLSGKTTHSKKLVNWMKKYSIINANKTMEIVHRDIVRCVEPFLLKA